MTVTRDELRAKVVSIAADMERLRAQLDVAHYKLLSAKKATINSVRGAMEASRKRNLLRMQYRSLYYIKSGLEDMLENLSH